MNKPDTLDAAAAPAYAKSHLSSCMLLCHGFYSNFKAAGVAKPVLLLLLLLLTSCAMCCASWRMPLLATYSGSSAASGSKRPPGLSTPTGPCQRCTTPAAALQQ
jgi:hypothetical protein